MSRQQIFTAPEIREAFSYAEIAYKNSTELSSLFGRSITNIDPLIEGKGPRAHVINEGERVVLMFPGSKDIFDWIRNLDYAEEGGFHSGISRALDAMADEIMDRLIALRPEHLLVTGHSFGGGLSHRFLEGYGKEFDCSIDCVTYAQPRIMSAEQLKRAGSVADLDNVRYLRVHTANDGVPHLPPSRLGFTHCGPSLEIGKKLSRKEQLQRMIAMWRSEKRLAITAIDDHLQRAYKLALAELR